MVSILQVFNCAPISINTETSITKPKLVSRSCVNTVVCVRKPGPMDELAIKKAAPTPAPPNHLIFNGFDDNLVLFQRFINGFGKYYCMCVIAMNTNSICKDRDFFA